MVCVLPEGLELSGVLGKKLCLTYKDPPLVYLRALCLAPFSFPCTLTLFVILYLYMASPATDDTQVILAFPPCDSQISARVSACLNDISSWMTAAETQSQQNTAPAYSW